MKLDWNNLPRSALDGTRIVEGARYSAKFYHAAPHAIAPQISHGRLANISLHRPGLHTFGTHEFEAELHLHFKGEPSLFFHEDTPDHLLVIPIEVNWAWDAPLHPALEWLEKPQDYKDPHECDWTWHGIARFVRNGFNCPPFHLKANSLFAGQNRALHYGGDGNCANTFVVTDSINVAGEQMNRVKQLVGHDWKEKELRHPGELVVAAVLLPVESFTVFSEQETSWRRRVYLTIMTIGVVGIVGCFLLVRRFSDVYEVDITEFASDRCVQNNTRLDHWVSYIIGLAVPWCAYLSGSTNSMTGMPYEYQITWYGMAMIHMLHELAMFVQVGGAVKRMSYRRVARLAILSFMGLVHFELQIQFSIIALMHGSYYSFTSLVTFVLTNIAGQLVLLSCRSTNTLRFKARSFEVLHGVLMKRLEELESAEDDSIKDKGGWRTFQAEDRNRFSGGDGQEGEHGSDSGIDGMWVFISTVGDVVQCVLQIAFVSKYGSSPVMYGSIALTTFYMVAGYIARIAPNKAVD
jgi:hypothetical protein